jgi:hypothetical protein
LKNENYIACPHPILDPFDPVMMSFMKNEPPLVCAEEEDWVNIKGNIARITDKALKKYGDIQCKFMGMSCIIKYVNFIVFIFIYFSDVLRANEFSTSVGVVTTTHTEYNLETSDFFRVYCESENSQHR